MSRHQINVIADDGQRYTRPVPVDWSEVPLVPYVRLGAATTLPTRIEALAALFYRSPQGGGRQTYRVLSCNRRRSC